MEAIATIAVITSITTCGLPYADDMRVVDEISEQHVQQTILDIKRKFGKNAVIKGMDMFADATGQQRNRQIGGHAA